MMGLVDVVILLGILLIVLALYEIVSVLRKKAGTYYQGEDGVWRLFGCSVYNLPANGFVFHDYRQPLTNRRQGYSNIEDGHAQINLRNNPSPDDLTQYMHREGWVDHAGNIFSSSGKKVGYITDAKGRPGISGSGKWYEFWLRKHSFVFACLPEKEGDSISSQDRLVGRVVETGRLAKAQPGIFTITARAAGFLLLYKEKQAQIMGEDAQDPRTTWRDTALPAAVIFTFLYGILYILGTGKTTFPALGEQIGFSLAMLLAYFAVWALLRQIKIEVSLEGRAFDDFLLLIDKNTGHGRLNNWILIAASAALLVSFFVYGSDFIALQAAILIGMWVNSHYVSRAPWAVSDTWEAPPSYDWDEEQEDNDASISRSFCWSLDSPFHDLSGELSIDFNTLEIEELRKANPFRLYPELTFKEKINSLLTSEKGYTKIHKILRYIDNQIRESGLGERERLQFILDFVQLPNIKFMGDEECDEIGRPQDYARFPDETLFDGRGDCDCKSALAAILFREAGYRTAYLITKDHAAVAVAFQGKANADLIDIAGSSVLTKDGYIYYFCETTGDGFRIGDLGDTRKEDLEEILYLD